ncbi:MAG: hypothetical protein WBP75_07170 [Candidatus Cybelea sp.]
MTWRPWLLALCALGLALIVANVVTDLTVGGSLGISGTPTAVAFVDRLAVRPGGAAAESGIRTGDLLDRRRLSPAARFRLFYGPRVGEPLVLPIVRNGVERTVTVVTHRPAGPDWTAWLFYAGSVWIALCCALIAWWRSESAEARLLIFYLLGVFVISQGLGDIVTPWPVVDHIGLLVKGLIFVPSFAFLALYAGCYATPVSAARRALVALAIALTVIAAARGVVVRFELWNGSMSPFTPSLLVRADPLARLFEGGAIIAVMLSLLAAFGASRGAERTRFTWALAAVLPPLIWIFIVLAAGEWLPIAVFASISALWWFAMPAILSYSLLSRRLFDIGFVFNRAAVFTGASVILLGAFVLVEWLLTDWLGTAGHATNVLVSGGVALALGLSIRFVHGRVDRVVDRVFFRRRHEDEDAIRTFTREAPYITDSDILVRRATETLERHTNATSVDIVLRYDENDPAILRLRADPHALDLLGLETSLHGDMAFPMTARGQLLGVVVLGPRRSGEKYAPDETSAISQLAASLGTTLDVFATRNGKGTVEDHVVASIDALREELVSAVTALGAGIVAANEGLRDEIARRSGGVAPT